MLHHQTATAQPTAGTLLQCMLYFSPSCRSVEAPDPVGKHQSLQLSGFNHACLEGLEEQDHSALNYSRLEQLLNH